MSHERPMVSVVTPAYNAAKTLPRALLSVQLQQFADWEHVVVDDGSEDDTVRIAVDWAAGDDRVRVVSQPWSGPSAARNMGLDIARGKWTLFLDADDTVRPQHMRRMLARAQASGCDSVCCGHRRLDPSGKVSARIAAPAIRNGAINDLDRRPVLAIHAALSRTDAVRGVGGFDTGLITNEDWDLWGKLARNGTRFARETRLLADYWMQPGSLSRQGQRMIKDAAAVVGRGRAGMIDDEGRLEVILWNAGVALGEERDWARLMETLSLVGVAPIDGRPLAAALADGLAVGSACSVRALALLWPRLDASVMLLLAHVAEALGAPGLDRAISRALAEEIAGRASLSRSLRIGDTVAMQTLKPRIHAAFGDGTVDTILLKPPLLRPRRTFAKLLPAPDPDHGGQMSQALVRALREQVADQVLALPPTRFIADRSVRALAVGRRVIERGRRTIAPSRAPMPGDSTPGGGTREDWDDFFQAEDPWDYGNAYEQLKYERTLELIGWRPGARALELACAEGRFSAMLAPRVGSLLSTDISQVALDRARERCAEHDNVDFRTLDFFHGEIEGRWDLIVCSEVLYYMDSSDMIEDFALRVADALKADGIFVHAHAYQLTDGPTVTGFDWGDPFSAHTISRVLSTCDAMERVAAVNTDLYAIEVFRKAPPAGPAISAPPKKLPLESQLTADLASWVIWNGAVKRRQDVERNRTYRLPVLMYHRVATDGPAELAPWRITPEAFEHQLRFLRRRGFHSISPEEWDETVRAKGVLKGRPILITFDDGYADFHAEALPILERNGFGAHMFVVSDKVGGSADWDSAAGSPAPLMDWDVLRDCRRRGVTFGSHLASHRAATLMSVPEMRDEACRSRATLEDRLGVAIDTVAPPYGETSLLVREICREAGYRRLFTVKEGMASIWAARMAIPRLEISGDCDIEAFAELMGLHGIEAPQLQDRP